MLRIGIDVGGTFTDVTAVDTADGTVTVYKLPSTSEDQSVAVAEGIAAVLERAGRGPAEVGYLGHGTTVATNVVLEENGARTLLVTTGGIRDLLEIARQQRPSLYDLEADKSPSLVPRSLVHTVEERIGADGKALRPLDFEDLAAVVRRCAEQEPEAVAVCFLHSYRNPEHEAAAVRALREALPATFVCASSDVAPVFREYERCSTTVVNAYVGPWIEQYMARLADRVDGLGIGVEPKVIGSSGGMMSLDSVRKHPVSTLLSGPSAGVVGATHVARVAGFTDLITFDMGGTSTDVCLVSGGTALTAAQRRINGRPIRTPSLDIHTVGAGGGSIASVDGGGALEVGPASAGSRPGPAAYGRGGTKATVTDANVSRGRLNPEFILGGALRVDAPAARRAVETIAEGMGVDGATAARGIGRIAAVNMAGAVRKVSVEAGADPRGFALVAFGGAGPLHAAEVAREVGIGTVLVPPNPGTLCALGLLATDIRGEFNHAALAEAATGNLEVLNEVLAQLHATATRWLETEAPHGAETTLYGTARMRYTRQNFELAVPLPEAAVDAARMTPAQLGDLIAGFHDAHYKAYGFAHEQAPVQLVEFAMTATARVERPELPHLPEGDGRPGPAAILGHRDADFDGAAAVRTPVYDRSALRAGDQLEGPAIVEQMDTTTVLTPDTHGRVDRYGNLIIELESA